MGGEGQLGQSLGRVGLLTFPASLELLPMVFDGDYLAHVGLGFFHQLFASMNQQLILCRTLEDDVVEWIDSPDIFLSIMHEAALCHRFHAVFDNQFRFDKKYAAVASSSPNYSPDIVLSPNQEMVDEVLEQLEIQKQKEVQKQQEELKQLELVKQQNFQTEQNLKRQQELKQQQSIQQQQATEQRKAKEQQRQLEAQEVEQENSLASSINVFGKLRTLFKRDSSQPSEELTASKSWWSASTQFFRPAAKERHSEVHSAPELAASANLTSSQVISRDRFATDRLSSSHHIFIPRMEYATAPSEVPPETKPQAAPASSTTSEPHFFIAPSWYKEADRMSASMSRMHASRNEVDGSSIHLFYTEKRAKPFSQVTMCLPLVLLTRILSLANAFSPGRIQFTPTQYAATNQWGSVYLICMIASLLGLMIALVQRALGSDGPAAVFLNTNNGTALSGIDFVPLRNKTVTWAADSWASVQLPIAFITRVLTQDLVFSVTMTPVDNTTAIYSPLATAFITIQAANLYPGDLGFTAPTINVTIPPLTAPTTPIPVLVPVGRFNGSYGNVQVQYSLAPVANSPVSNIPAEGIDYKVPSSLWGNALLWLDGDDTTKSIALNVFNTALYRNTKQLAVNIYFPTGGSNIIKPSTAIITIVGNIQDAPTGVLLLQAPCFPSCVANTYTIEEGGAVRVFVQRQNGTFGSVSVQYSVLPDPSTNTQTNIDFVPVSGILSWLDGDSSSQSFVVQTKRSPNTQKQAMIKIYSPTGGASILSNAATSIIVINSAPAPPDQGGEVDFIVQNGIQLSLSTMTLASDQVFQSEIAVYQSGIENSKSLVATKPGNLTFIVRRVRGSQGSASVYLQTISQTAIAGVDYVAVGQLLQWADGDTTDKLVNVTILSPSYTLFNGLSTVPKSFSLDLSSPTNAILGPFSQYLVLLQGTQQGNIYWQPKDLDIVVPSLIAFTLDMTAKLLLLQYSFPVLAATANLALLTLRASPQGPSYTLTTNSVVIPDANPALVRISLHAIDMNGIENQAGLAQSAPTSFITYPPGFVQYPTFSCGSTAVNGCVVPPMPAQQPFAATSFNSDTLSPTLVRFTFDGQYLLLRFSKVIDPLTISMSQLRLCDSNTYTTCATLSSSSYIVQGTRSAGPNTLLPSSPGDGTLITIFVGPVDQVLIKSTGSGLIGIAATSTFIILSNQIQDIFQHPLLPPFAMGATISPDCSPCPANSYASQRCSDTTSRVCTPCTVCPFDHFEKNACTPTRDRICQRCTQCHSEQYSSPTCTATSDRVCQQCTQCTTDQYEATPCTTETNRVCLTCNSCTLTPAQYFACTSSVSWQRLQRSPYGCPTANQKWTSEEQRLQAAKSHECSAGRCSCTGNGVGNNNPTGLSFPDDPRCTGPSNYGIIL